MKVIITIVLAVVAYLGISISFIWAIVEFILYLVKDKDFNWWSIWSIILCVVTAVVLTFVVVFMEHKAKRDVLNSFGGKKSKFQQRLEEMQAKRKQP